MSMPPYCSSIHLKTAPLILDPQCLIDGKPHSVPLSVRMPPLSVHLLSSSIHHSLHYASFTLMSSSTSWHSKWGQCLTVKTSLWLSLFQACHCVHNYHHNTIKTSSQSISSTTFVDCVYIIVYGKASSYHGVSAYVTTTYFSLHLYTNTTVHTILCTYTTNVHTYLFTSTAVSHHHHTICHCLTVCWLDIIIR